MDENEATTSPRESAPVEPIVQSFINASAHLTQGADLESISDMSDGEILSTNGAAIKSRGDIAEAFLIRAVQALSEQTSETAVSAIQELLQLLELHPTLAQE